MEMKIQKIGDTPKTKRKIDYLVLGGLSLIFLPFVIVGICKAYDAAVLNGLESALTSNMQAVTSTNKAHVDSVKACNSAYEALKAYKVEAKLALVGSGNPCEGF